MRLITRVDIFLTAKHGVVVDSELCVCVCSSSSRPSNKIMQLSFYFILLCAPIIDWTWGWNSGWDIHCTELQGRQL